MSFSIWMQCAGISELRPLRVAPWRVVESQHEVSTRKLVDSSAEQELLEQLIDDVKPAIVIGARQHYLLFTPFRYPPLRHGSRFGTRQERGIWYGSELQRTAFAEVAYYRLLFLEGTHAALGVVMTLLTAFTVRMRSTHAIDLTRAPFDAHQPDIASPTTYAASQQLGHDMRSANVEMFRFQSARDDQVGNNIGAFTPAVFHLATPQHFERWHCSATASLVEFVRGDLTKTRDTHSFDREQFLVDDTLPSPAF